MFTKLCVAAGFALALVAPAVAEQPRSGSAGLGIGADAKGRAPITPPEASTITESGRPAGTITHSDGVSASTQDDAKASAGVGASRNTGASGTTGSPEAQTRGETSGTID